MQLLAVNPGRKARHGRRKRRTGGKAPMAHHRHKRRRRKGSSGSGGSVSGRRRRRGGFVSLSGASFSVKTAVVQGAIATGGAVAVNMLINKVAGMLPASLTSGTGRSLSKVALGVGLGIAAKKFGMGKYAAALATGGIVAGLIDIASSKLGGMAGIDYFGADQGVAGLGQLTQYPDGCIYDQAGRLVYVKPQV